MKNITLNTPLHPNHPDLLMMGDIQKLVEVVESSLFLYDEVIKGTEVSDKRQFDIRKVIQAREKRDFVSSKEGRRTTTPRGGLRGRSGGRGSRCTLSSARCAPGHRFGMADGAAAAPASPGKAGADAGAVTEAQLRDVFGRGEKVRAPAAF